MNWQITTDLHLYNRSGYSDHTLNTTNWVLEHLCGQDHLKEVTLPSASMQ